MHGLYALPTILIVYCMGFIVLLIFAYILHGFYHVVDICLCIVWVLSFCYYLIVCSVGFIILFVFACVSHGVYGFVGI